MPPSSKDVIAELERRGFVFRQGKGSHKVGAHPDGRTTTVPLAKELKKGMLRKIERDTKEKFT